MNIIEGDLHISQSAFKLEKLDYGTRRLPDVKTDAGIMYDNLEELIGLGFVCFETYVTASIVHLRRVFPTCQHKDKEFRQASIPISCGVPSTDVIWAAANYYKHNDDWKKHWWQGDGFQEDWRLDGRTKETILLLGRLNATSITDYPCVQFLEVLQGDNWQLSAVLDLVENCRKFWFIALHKAAEWKAL